MIATTSTHNHHSSFAMKRSTDDLGGSESNSERLNKRNKQGNTTGFTRQGGEELFEEQKQQRSPFLSSSSGDPQTLQEGRAFGGIPSSNLYSGSQVQMMMNQQQLLQGQQQLNPTSPQGVQLLLNELNRTQQQEAAASTLLAQARMNSANAAAAADNIFLQQAMGNQQQQQLGGYPNLASTARMNPYAASSNFPGTSVMGQSSEQQTGGIDPLTMAALAQMNRLGGTGGGGGGQDDLLLGQQPPSLSIQNLLQRQGAAHAAAAPQDPYVALLMQSMATGGGGGTSNAAALMGGGGQQHAGLQARTQFQLPSDQLVPSIPRMSASDNFGAASAATTSALSAPAPSAGAASAKTSSSKDGIPLSLPSDANNLSEYQCLLRAQIDLFAATDADIEGNAQGRNKPIVRHQVGIRCRHCHMNPSPSRRSRGAVYFPAKLSGLYQAAQNMAINHFTESCRNLDEETREKLAKLKERKSYKLGGGKGYWATGARIRNVIEVDSRLFFEDSKPSATSDSASASAGPKKKSKK